MEVQGGQVPDSCVGVPDYNDCDWPEAVPSKLSTGSGAVITYTPKTIDISHVGLSSSLEELVERLAENNHDHWARKRIAEGWPYGGKRDDDAKEHPDLVLYGQLPESEKEYDRKTVIEVLKAIIALGYELRKVN